MEDVHDTDELFVEEADETTGPTPQGHYARVPPRRAEYVDAAADRGDAEYYYDEEEDEDSVYHTRMADLLLHHQFAPEMRQEEMQQKAPRRREPHYSHLRKQRSLGEVLDGIEYHNSSNMVHSNVARLYKDSGVPKNGGFLRKGQRNVAMDEIAERKYSQRDDVCKPPKVVVYGEKKLSPAVVVAAVERNYVLQAGTAEQEKKKRALSRASRRRTRERGWVPAVSGKDLYKKENICDTKLTSSPSRDLPSPRRQRLLPPPSPQAPKPRADPQQQLSSDRQRSVPRRKNLESLKETARTMPYSAETRHLYKTLHIETEVPAKLKTRPFAKEPWSAWKAPKKQFS